MKAKAAHDGQRGEGDDHRREPPPGIPERDHDERCGDGGNEQGKALPVVGDPILQLATAGNEDPGCRDAQDASGDVDQEDQAPAARGEEESTDNRPERETERLGRSLDADTPPEPVSRQSHVDDRHAVRLQHGRSRTLNHSEDVEPEKSRSDGTESGTEDEHEEAIGVEKLAPDHVGQAADCRDSGDEHDQVAQADPCHRPEACVEGSPEGRERDRHDAGVELAHECADADRGEGVVVGLRPVSHPLGTPRLSQPVAVRHGQSCWWPGRSLIRRQGLGTPHGTRVCERGRTVKVVICETIYKRSPIDLRRLDIFLAVAEEGGFTAAADLLEMTQPAVSQAVRELETTLRHAAVPPARSFGTADPGRRSAL